MGTATIPYSNPAGNNQTSPSSKAGAAPVLNAGTIPGSPTSSIASNPYAPATTSTSGATANTSAASGFITNNSSYSSGQNDLQKQEIDIYGKGVGGSIYSLLNNMSGTNSTILQEYIQSLQPQEAAAQANVNAALGAGGVSANSSVAAIADSNLQAQEFASIAGESAKLTQSQEEMTLQTLLSQSKDAASEVSASGWTAFGDVMGSIAQDIGAISHGGAGAMPGASSSSAGSASNYAMTMGSQPAQLSGLGSTAAPADFSYDELMTLGG